MKRLFALLLLTYVAAATATTFTPIQLLNPAGSTSGQAIVSTGASTSPAWANVAVANVTGAAPLNAPSFTGGVGIAGGLSISTGGASISAGGLSVVGNVSGTGFSNYLASPPAIGGTAAAAGSFTTLSASGTVSGTGFSTYLASPPAIGGTTAAAGTFTTLKSTNDKVIANNSSAQSIPNNASTVVTGWTSVLNQGGHFVPSTGIYTVPATGQYRVSAQLSYASSTWGSGTFLGIQVAQAGTSKYQNLTVWGAAQVSAQYYTNSISVVLNCATNDTITVNAIHAQGAAVLLNSAPVSNYLMIEQLP